jgi:hypothetical protein
MATRLTRAPSRSFEPLARRICKAVYDIMEGKRSQWVPLTRVAEHVNVKHPELLNGAISYASERRWLMVGGQPVHSLLLTEPGAVAALSKK